MSTLIEAMAKAIAETELGPDRAWERLHQETRKAFVADSIAALKAMKEHGPTPEMWEAFGADIEEEVFPGYFARMLQAAIEDASE
jgi:hypothetical protein